MGNFWAQGRARGFYLFGSWNCRGHFYLDKFHWAQGRAQGVYLLGVLKLALGTFRSTGPKAGPKEPISLSATRVETAVGQGRAQGVYLLRVLTLQLGSFRFTGPTPGPRSLSGRAFRSTGPKAGPKESICYGSCWAVFVSLAQRRAQGVYLLRVLTLQLGSFRFTGPTPGPRSMWPGLSFHWAQGRAQGVYLLRVLKLPLETFCSKSICCGSWNCRARCGLQLALATRGRASAADRPKNHSLWWCFRNFQVSGWEEKAIKLQDAFWRSILGTFLEDFCCFFFGGGSCQEPKHCNLQCLCLWHGFLYFSNNTS